MKVRGRLVGGLLGALAVGTAGAILRRSVARFEVAEESMAPALLPGDYVLARSPGEPRRGAIVLFPHPDSTMHSHLVKRIVGLGGETIEIANGQLHVDGRPLAEPWAHGPTLASGRWSIGRSEVFVVGDNRTVGSVDSRSFGPIPATSLQWRVAFRYWPAARFGAVSDLAVSE